MHGNPWRKKMRLSKADIKAIKRRLKRATPLPWVMDTSEPYDCMVWGPVVNKKEGDEAVVAVGGTFAPVVPGNRGRELFQGDIRNCEFLAHARKDIEDLLTDLEEAQKLLGRKK
jgi:hypothetical protein